MSDMLLQLRITADGKVAVQALSQVAGAEREVEAQTKRTGSTADEAKRKTDAWVAALLRKKETLGMSWAELKKYEAAQLAMTEAERRGASALVDAIDKQERYGAAAEKVGRVLGGLAATALQAGAAMAGVIAKESIQAALEAEQANLKVEAVLKATGHAAGMTKKDLDDLADSMAASTRFDDESIRNASAILLTFRSVSKESFGEAMQAAADLASVMGTDLNSAVLMIGKALEEPEHGLTALTRAGIQFTAAQKETIKGLVEQGKKAEAAKLILQELKSQGLDGVAQAMNTGLGKATSDLRKGWNELLEEIGRTEAVGGTAVTYMTGLTQIMKDLQDQIAGTSDRFRRFFMSEEFLGSAVYKALRQLGMSDPYAGKPQAGNRARGRINTEAADQQRADVGRVNQMIREQQDLVEQRAQESKKAAEKEAEAYARVVKAADDYLASLGKQVAAVGATTEQKIMLEAAARSLTLKTEEERKAFLASAAALAHQVQTEEDAVAAKKHAADDYKKIVELEKQRAKALDEGTTAMQRELDQLTKTNDEFGRSRQEIEEATLAKLEHELATKDFTTATYEEIDALEKRIEIQKRIIGEGRRADHLQAMKDEAEEVKRMAEGMGDAVSEAIMEGGIDGAQFLKRLFAQLVLRPIIQPIMQNIVGALFGSNGQGGGLSGMNLLGNLGNLAGGLGGRYGGMLGSAAGSSLFSGTSFGSGLSIAGTNFGEFGLLGGTAESISSAFSLFGAGEFGAGLGSLAGALGPISMAIAGVAMIARMLDDGPENPRARLAFSPGSTSNPFGGATFAMNEGGFDTAAVERFFRSFGGFDRQLAGAMTPEQVARIQGRLGAYNTSGRRWDGQPAEFAFPEGTGEEAAQQLMMEYLKQKYSAVFDEIEAGLGDLILAFEGTSEELGQMIQSLYALTEVGKSIDAMIAEISGNGAEAVRSQIEAMNRQVDRAQGELDAALEAKDPTAILQAEQQLSQAVMNRYNTELGMIRQLQDAIASLRDQAYQFQMQVAQRINAVGGSRDLGAISMNRALQLRAGIGGNANLPGQIRDLNSYIGAIDNWYNARRSEIERQAAADQAAAQAIAQAQQAAAQARIAQLQGELEMAQQFAGVVERAREAIDAMRLTATNPLALSGRLGLATGDAAAARSAYNAAGGEAKADAANRYLSALQERLKLAQEAYQRASPEYQAIYNEIIAEMTRVEADAKTEAQKSVELQRQIVELQEQSNGYAAASASAASASSAALDALNAEALDYYTWAEAEGARLYAEQERRHQEQLDAITGGQDAELYIAQRARETVDVLEQIRDSIATFLSTAGSTGSSGTGSDSNSTEGGAAGGDSSLGSGGDKSATVVLELDGQVLGKALIPAVDARILKSGTVIKRALQNA